MWNCKSWFFYFFGRAIFQHEERYFNGCSILNFAFQFASENRRNVPPLPCESAWTHPRRLGKSARNYFQTWLEMLPTCPGEVLELTPNHLPFPHMSFHFFSFPPIFLAFASIFYIFLFFHVFKYFQIFFRIKKYFSIEDENGAKVFFSYTPIDLVSVTAE